jgi:hypothetical protein
MDFTATRLAYVDCSFGIGQIPVVGSCKYADKPLDFIKQEEF